jgi:hypothetical protein
MRAEEQEAKRFESFRDSTWAPEDTARLGPAQPAALLQFARRSATAKASRIINSGEEITDEIFFITACSPRGTSPNNETGAKWDGSEEEVALIPVLGLGDSRSLKRLLSVARLLSSHDANLILLNRKLE